VPIPGLLRGTIVSLGLLRKRFSVGGVSKGGATLRVILPWHWPWPVAEGRSLAKVLRGPIHSFSVNRQEGRMDRLVIGLFESRGIAEDACNRLKTEGVPASEIALRVLSQVGPIPSSMEPELDAAFLSPVILGDFRDSFASYIRNGETLVCVLALTEERVELAVDTLKQYTPLQVGVASPSGDPNARTIDRR
jgi:hypothetical protein